MRALGQLLAGYRQAARLNQRQLAPHTLYGRSTVANVETGRQNVPRSFWERADAVLGAGGTLVVRRDGRGVHPDGPVGVGRVPAA